MLEHALGTSDSAPGDQPRATAALETTLDGTFQTLAFPRNLAADDVLYEVQISSDLITWRSGPGEVEFVSRTRNPDNTTTERYRPVHHGLGAIVKHPGTPAKD